MTVPDSVREERPDETENPRDDSVLVDDVVDDENATDDIDRPSTIDTEEPVEADDTVDADDVATGVAAVPVPDDTERPADERDVPDQPDLDVPAEAHGEPTLYGEPAVAEQADERDVPDQPDLDVPAEAHGEPTLYGEPAVAEQTDELEADRPEASADLMPGAAPAQPVTDLWHDGQAQGLHERWQDIQLRFVDDPRAAVEAAEALISEATEALTAALAEGREALRQWREDNGEETERLRMALQRHREFLDRILGR